MGMAFIRAVISPHLAVSRAYSLLSNGRQSIGKMVSDVLIRWMKPGSTTNSAPFTTENAKNPIAIALARGVRRRSAIPSHNETPPYAILSA